MPYLDRNATIADVIAWVLAIPAIFSGLLMAPYMLYTIPKFKAMFDALHGQLPAVTVFILGQGWWFFTLVPFALVIGMVAVVVRSRQGTIKIAAAFVAQLMLFGIVAMGIEGLFYPIQQLQQAIKQDANSK